MAGTPQHPRAARRYIRVDISPRIVAWVLALALGGWLLVELREVVLVVVVALMLAGTVSPLLEFLERRHIRRSWGVLLVLLGLLGGLGLVGLLTVPPLVRQVGVLAAQAPAYREHLAGWLEGHRLLAPLAHSLREAGGSGLLSQAARYALAYSEKAALLVGYTVTTLVLAVYFVADASRIRGAVYSLIPRAYHLRVSRILVNLEAIVGGYIRGQVITSVCIAVFAFALLSVLRVPNALALAAFAGLTDVLPFVGGLLATTPAALGALSRGLPSAIVVVVAMVLYQEFESRVLVPRVYGRVLRLPAIVVVLALLIGGKLMGIIGALLALPIAAGIRMAGRELRVELPGEALEDSHLRERDARAEQSYERRTAGAPAKDAAAVAVEMAEGIRHEDAEQHGDAADVPITGGPSPGAHEGPSAGEQGPG